ncbi:MAG: hypothetical protein ABIK89_04745 [Planctomycetota bacterium]
MMSTHETCLYAVPAHEGHVRCCCEPPGSTDSGYGRNRPTVPAHDPGCRHWAAREPGLAIECRHFVDVGVGGCYNAALPNFGQACMSNPDGCSAWWPVDEGRPA